MPNVSTSSQKHEVVDATAIPRAERLFHFICLTLTLVFPALLCLAVAYVAEPDIWWHLSSGEWILSHHAFPRIDTFSSTTMGHPWQAYSWLFEVLLSKLYSHFGLVGIVGYTTAMILAITAALFHLIYASQKSLRIALPLTAISAFALLTLFSPRPWHFTILFFVLQLAIIQKARRSGEMRRLFLLPFIFALWANLHIQFIEGLLLLMVVLTEALLFNARRSKDLSVARIKPSIAAALLAACAAATCINPYGWHIYSVARALATQPGVVNWIEELKAMPFRAASNYAVLFLTLAAAAVLARKHRFHFFETTLLVAAATLSFRSQRDIWIVVAVNALILSQNSAARESQDSPSLSSSSLVLAMSIAAFLLLGAARLIHLSEATLRPKLAIAMPVDASAFVRDHHIAGPVFCDFIWGGYLMHALDLPVSMDGRAALHGDEQLDRSARTFAGAPDWSTNPQLNAAGVVVAPVSAALTQLLRSDPRFDRVYEDKQAAVFVPHNRSLSSSTSLH